MTGPERRSVSTWDELQRAFGEPINFLMTGECVPFAFDFPPVDEVVDILRRDSDVRITQNTRGDKLDLADLVEHYRDIPLDDMLAGEFGVAHFKLPSFYGAGQFLHGFEDRVMAPWRDALSAHGFTWERCYPIIFISGRNSATNYHMDYSHVIAWQIHGSKRFCGLVDPAAWTTSQQRVTYNPDSFERPADLTDDDFLCYDMPPGAVLWNALLTPHAVTAAADRVAMSVNLSHGGLRLNGELCHFEQELFDDRTARGLRTDNIVV